MRRFLQLVLCFLLGLPSILAQKNLPLMGVGGVTASNPTITRIQSKDGAGAPAMITLNGTVAGRLIIVCGRFGDLYGATATVTGTNTYTAVYAGIGAAGWYANWCFYAKNISGGNETITCDLAGETVRCYAVEYSGASTTAPIDTVATATGNSTSLASGSVACNSCGMIIGFGTTVGGTPVVGSGFSSATTTMNDTISMLEDKAVTSATSATESASTGNWVMAGFTLK